MESYVVWTKTKDLETQWITLRIFKFSNYLVNFQISLIKYDEEDIEWRLLRKHISHEEPFQTNHHLYTWVLLLLCFSAPNTTMKHLTDNVTTVASFLLSLSLIASIWQRIRHIIFKNIWRRPSSSSNLPQNHNRLITRTLHQGDSLQVDRWNRATTNANEKQHIRLHILVGGRLVGRRRKRARKEG